jgi:hypothetical protein
MLSREAIHDAIRAEIAAAGQDGGDRLVELGPADDFFELGLVDSFGMMNIVHAVEDLAGTPVDFMVVEPEVFCTLDGIADYLLDDPPPP